MKKIYFITLLILAITSSLVYSNRSLDRAFLTPDESVLYKYTLLYNEKGLLYDENPLNREGELNIYHGRGESVKDEITYSKKFLGFPFFVGTISLLFNELAIVYFTIFIAILGFIWIFLIAKKLGFNPIITAILLLFFPAYWYWSNYSLLENVAGSVFFITGYYYLLKSLENKNISNPILMSLFLNVVSQKN